MNRDPVDQIGNTAERVIAPNVYEFLFRAAEMYGRLKADEFGQRQQAIILEGNSESPIEDLFWIAFEILCEVYGHDINPDPDFGVDGTDESVGIFAHGQQVIGPYRVDFCVNRVFLGKTDDAWVRKADEPVVVELDGHDFHDKDKRQRSYEKARDRYLVNRGYRVLHFTGSDVVRDPFRVAHEVLELLRATDGPYNPDNPTGLE